VSSDESGQVAGKVVAITGAGRGIGAATARLLAGRGARVVLGSRSEKELTATADAIAGSGGEVAYQCIDVTQPGIWARWWTWPPIGSGAWTCSRA
jgi:NAD(P)-dependent dehydrogenase (short-subunit alcohol dehydrogenase family)